MKIPFYNMLENIPKTLYGLSFVGLETYPTEDLGISLRYAAISDNSLYLNANVDIYIYNLGYEKITESVNSQFFESLAQGDYNDISEIYKDYEKFKFHSFGLNQKIVNVIGSEAWVGSLEFTRTIQDLLKVHFHDFYLLSKVDNHFIKLRMTFADHAQGDYPKEDIINSVFSSIHQFNRSKK